MRNISRKKAQDRVEKAISEERPEFKSHAWDFALRSIQALESRAIGDDRKVAEELRARMRSAVASQ